MNTISPVSCNVTYKDEKKREKKNKDYTFLKIYNTKLKKIKKVNK